MWLGHSSNSGLLFGHNMDPSWRELKQILHHHEEISEANRSALHQLSIKVGNLEQSFTQSIESLESECRFLRTLVLPQPIQSLSINQVLAASCHGNSEDGQGELGVAPMDVKEDSPLQSEAQGVPDNESTVN